MRVDLEAGLDQTLTDRFLDAEGVLMVSGDVLGSQMIF